MSESLKWKTLSEDVKLDSPWLRVAAETCTLPNGKTLKNFYTLWQPDWVLVMARDSEGMWILTRQYRHGSGCMEIEFPAGIMDAGEDAVVAGKRELQEECGYGSGEWSWMRSLPVNPDRHKGHFHMVRAEGVVRQGTTAWDEAEHIEMFKASTERVREMIAEGLISHPHHIAAFYLMGL